MTASGALNTSLAKPVAGPWTRHLLGLGVAALGLLMLFFRDAADMAGIWWNTSTFNHCLLIPPLIAWLVWVRKAELAQLTPTVSPLGLGIVALGAASWLVGEAGSVALARHLGLILMLQGSVVTLLGIAVARGLLFPLAYALFLVPFGEEFVPALQSITAKLTMFLLGVSGLPAYMEGVFITTPSGYFEVAEACSGVKFLIAMIALGALTANLCFTSWVRRAAFMAACIVIPILANGIRAFGTIYIADKTGIEFAENFDHVFYGWFFFAFVIAAVMALGWKFFEREIDDPAFDPTKLQTQPVATDSAKRLGTMTAIVLAFALAPALWLSVNAATGRAEVPDTFTLPDIAGWNRSDDAPMAYPWQATYAGADRVIEGRYVNGDGQIVDLAMSYFSLQSEGHELVAYGQGGLPAETEWSWSEDTASPDSGHAYRIIAPGPVSRDVVQYALVGDLLTGSDSRAKLETMRRRLLGGDQHAIGILISAEGEDARQIIDNFLSDSGGAQHLVDRVTSMAD